MYSYHVFQFCNAQLKQHKFASHFQSWIKMTPLEMELVKVRIPRLTKAIWLHNLPSILTHRNTVSMVSVTVNFMLFKGQEL